MTRAFWLGLVAVAALFLWSCKSSVDPADNGTTKLVTTTIVGTVIDEDGRPVQGAQVSGHGATATTDDAGVFLLKDIRAPFDRCVVMVRKGGYFTGSRAAYPTENKVTMMRLTLQEALVTSTVQASAGGTVSTDGASVQLPANGFVTSTGTPYTGTVSVAMRYQDPLASDFYESFSGDMAAVRTDGSQTELTSYGVVRVLLTGTGGQRLQLKDGATATITYPAAGANMTEIPLWYYDETKGIWTEEGKAVKTGNAFVGTVSHFTDWNLDVPNARRAYIEGRVTCGDNMPLPGIVVRIGQVQAITNEDGMYHRRVPADVAFDVEVVAPQNNGISAAPTNVGPIAQDQTLRHDVLVSPCPTVLEASMVDCNDQPIGGVLQITTPTGSFTAASSTGAFRAIVPSGTALTLDGFSFDARSITTTNVAPIAVGTTYNAGTLKACSGEETSYLDIKLPEGETPWQVTLNADGSKAAVITQGLLLLYDVNSGSEVWRVPTSTSSAVYSAKLSFVAADARIALSLSSGTTIFDASTGATITQITQRGAQFVTPNGASIYVLPDSAQQATSKLVEFDGLTGAERRTVTLSAPQPYMRFLGLQGNGVAVLEAYSPMAIYLYDLSTGDTIRTVNFGAGRGESGMLSPSGKVVATYLSPGGPVGVMTFVDLTSGAVLSQMNGNGARVLAISADDAEFVSSEYGSVGLPSIKDVATQSVRRRLPWLGGASENYPMSFGYSGDSKKLGTLTGEKTNDPILKRSILRIYTLR
jgi:protocatechuate 3,4-dioxygenase beta subunit